jgi:hypothetical protein
MHEQEPELPIETEIGVHRHKPLCGKCFGPGIISRQKVNSLVVKLGPNFLQFSLVFACEARNRM